MSLTELPNQKVAALDFLSGGGEMGERIRNFDWSKTPLGPPQFWEQSLKTCVRIMLTSSQPIWIGWGKDLIKLYNDAYKEIVGGKHPDALGQPAKVVWKEIWQDIEPLLEQVMGKNEGTYSESQLLIMHRHGYEEEVYYTFSYSPVPGDDGGTAGMICYNTSDTERVINERSLATLQHLESIAKRQSVNEIYEAAAKAIEFNNKDFPFAVIYKIDNETSTAMPAAFAGIPADQNLFPLHIDLKTYSSETNNLRKAYLSKEIVVSENAGRRKNIPTGFWQKEATNFIHIPIVIPGNENPVAIVSAALNPYRKFDNAFKQFAQLIADRIGIEINNVLNYEQEKKKAAELAELDRAKTVFFSNISHEFRTPLTLMLGSLEESLSDVNTIPRNIERMTVTHRNAMRLLKLVNTLLDFSRIESGRQKANYSLTDIASLTKNLASNFRSIIEKAGLKFIVKADAVIQPLYIDKQMWEKIVFNLLSNAFKYTLGGSITLRLFADTKNVILEIEDTGVGIPEKELPHMFDRFHRVENVVGRTYEGSGIGLSLTKELVLLHGGKISVKSKEGKGSTFTVSIPYGKDHLPADQTSDISEKLEDLISDVYVEEAASLLGEAQGSSISNKSNGDLSTVLVVDDNADMRLHIKSLLEKNYRVVTAVNGMEALHKIKEEHPSMVISDIMMPIMDGTQLVKEIKQNKNTENIPVILLTARAGEESRIEGYQIGADDYLTKPFSSKELLARIEGQLKITEKRHSIENQLHSLFEQAPSAIVIFKGPDAIFELANRRTLEIIGKTKEEVIGRKLEEALPELKGQGYIEMIKQVYSTGTKFISEESPVTFINNGNKINTYVKYVFQPLKDEKGNTTGVMVVGDDVSAQALARKKIEESENRFKNVLLQSPSIFCILEGPDMVIRFANKPLLESWGKSSDIVGKKLLEVLPELEGQQFPKLLQQVYETGKHHIGKEEKATIVKDGKLVEVYYNYVYQPIFESDGDVSGITVMATDITDEVVARKKIEQSEKKLQHFIQQAPVGIAVYSGKDFVVEAANEMVLEMWGKTIDEVKGKPMEVIFPEIHSLESVKIRHEHSVERFLKGETHVVKEEQLTFKRNGELHTGWYNYTHQPIFDEDGNPSGVIAVATDVTEQVLSRKRVEESEQELQSLLKQAPVFFMLFEGEDLIAKVANKAALELIGKTEEEVLNRSIDEYFPELGERKKIYLDVYHKQKPYSAFEVPISFMRNGELHEGFYNLNYMPWYSVDGKVKGVLATGIEVTEQVVARRKIEESEKELESLANAMPQLVWIAQPNGDVIFYNDRVNEFSGVKKMPDGQWSWEGLLHSDDLELTQAIWNKALNEKSVYETEHRILMNDGSYRWHLSRAFPIRDSNDIVVKWYGTATDIHEIKSSEEQIRKSELALRQTKEQLELSISAGKIGIWHWDVKKNQMTWSDEQLEIFGVDRKDFNGKAEDFFNYIIEEDKEKVKAISKLEFERADNQYEFRIRRNSGEIRWIQSRSKTYMDENGYPQYITGVNIDITDQVLARKKIEESEKEIQKLFMQAPVSIVLFEGEDLIAKVANDTAFKTLGKHPDEIINRSIFKFFSELPERTKLYTEVYRTGIPYQGKEIEIKLNRNGQLQTGYFDMNYTPWYDTDGRIKGVMTVGVEVTEQVLARRKIEESEGRFRTMANEAPLFVWETDENLQTTYLNQEGINYFNIGDSFKMEELSWKKFIHPDDQQNVLAVMWEAVEKSQSYTLEMRLRNGRTGQYRWFLDKGAPRYINDRFIGFIGTSLDIHERKEIEKELELKVKERTRELDQQNTLLQKQNELVRKIFDASVDSIAVYDKDMRIITLNQSALNIFAKRPEELIGKNLLDIVPQMKGAKGHQDLVRALNGETIHNKIYLSGVSNRYYENFLLPLKDEKENVYAVLVIAHDNTDLIESSKKLSDAQEIAQMGYWEWDVVTGQLTWSDNMYNIYEIDNKDGISFDKFSSLIHPDDRTNMQANIEFALQSRVFNDFFHRIITPAGEEKIMHARGEVIVDKEGKILKMVGTGQDVTKQKLTEQELISTSKKIEERNQFIEQLINSSLDLITVIDKDLRLINLNRKAQLIYKEYYKEDIIGKKITDIDPPVKGTESFSDVQHAFNGKVIIRDKVKSTISDKYYEHNYVPLTNASGEVYAVMIISHDITESMRQMEELRKLYESDEQKNNFIAMASHELKTPITSIKGYVQLLLNALEKEKDNQKPLPPLLVRSSLMSVDKQIKRLTRLISELLDISKIETGTLELKKEKFSLNQLAIETVEDILYTNTKHTINLYHDFHGNIYGDKDRIGQVMINFLTNAIKYSPDNDKIDVTIHKISNTIAFSVKDHGIGIDKAEQKRIFERFYRAKGKAEQTYPGFGIGLFIANEFIQKHGGQVWVESERGKGSTFTFTLPILNEQ